MQSKTQILAPAFTLFPSLKPPNKTLTFHQFTVLAITFLAYASFHASRKPPSIVKGVLGPKIQLNSSTIESNLTSLESNGTGWAPFNGPKGTHRLGELDLAFLSAYSIGMYFAGHVGDRIDLRLFLVFGMVGSGLLTIIFGLGYWFNVHLLGYFVSVQILCGLFQSIGWPCVVAVVGNWFGKDKRGLIMGIWTSHTSVGNIIGSVVASGVLEFGWGWSFVVPGVLVILAGVLVFLFLVVNPEDIGFETPGKEIEMDVEVNGLENLEKVESEEAGLLGEEKLGFNRSHRIPGGLEITWCGTICFLPLLFKASGVHFSILVALLHKSHRCCWRACVPQDCWNSFNGIRYWRSLWRSFGRICI